MHLSRIWIGLQYGCLCQQTANNFHQSGVDHQPTTNNQQYTMYQSNISVIDSRTGKIRQQLCPDATVTLSSKAEHWQDLRVEQQYLPASETPQMTSIGDLICVRLSAPLLVESTGTASRWINFGCFCSKHFGFLRNW